MASIVPVKVYVNRVGSQALTTLQTFAQRDGSFRVTFNPARTEYGTYRYEFNS